MSRAIKTDIKAARKFRLHWRGLLGVFVGALLLNWLFDHFGRLDLVRPTAVAIIVDASIVYLKRDVARRTWFLGTMTVLVALQVALILSVSWTTRWIPALTTAGVASLDFIAMLAIVDAVGEAVTRERQGSGHATKDPGRPRAIR